MFETTRPYSEERYLCKAELKEELDGMVLESVWNQVQEYRQLFRWQPFIDERWYMTRNPLILYRVEQVQQIILQYQQLPKRPPSDSTLSLLQRQRMEESSSLGFSLLVHRLELPLHQRMQYLLLREDCSWLLRFFLLLRFHKEQTLVCTEVFLHSCGFTALQDVALLSKLQIAANVRGMEEDGDLTPALLVFLSELQLQISNRMVSLEGNRPNDLHMMDEQLLQELYPAMTRPQASFYVQHHEPHHFYTITQFMEACEVCYETARTSMDALVQLCCYRKEKIGKKFVYYTAG